MNRQTLVSIEIRLFLNVLKDRRIVVKQILVVQCNEMSTISKQMINRQVLDVIFKVRDNYQYIKIKIY